MAYTKNTWETGDIVSSQKLNHMEDGIANSESVMVINVNDQTLDKTWQEIYDAMSQGKLCVVRTDFGNLDDGISTDTVSNVAVDGSEYSVVAGTAAYAASSATGYPAVK